MAEPQQSARKAPSLSRGVLWLVLAVCVVARLPGITNPLLDFHAQRQCQTATVSRNYYEGGFRFLFPEINWAGGDRRRAGTEFPLYCYVTALLALLT